jgi:hypothetical protein
MRFDETKTGIVGPPFFLSDLNQILLFGATPARRPNLKTLGKEPTIGMIKGEGRTTEHWTL